MIILASTSPYRKALLEKLNIKFKTASPNINEAPLSEETPSELVARLAEEKAKAIRKQFVAGIVIGSDQVATFDDGDKVHILGKPHTEENAIKQLNSFSGHTVTFLTGLSLYDIESQKQQTCVVPFKVHFRHLTNQQLTNYVKAEQPLNCAGSFKSEGLGICLFDKLEGDDPNALIGLPLIQLNKMLLNWGVDILKLQESQ